MLRDAPRPADADEVIVALDGEGAPRPIGKLAAHQSSIRHLAVSIFVFRAGELLLQQRAPGKYHSPGLWANTCCSHPRWGEAVEACAARRLGEEMGFTVPLEPFGVVEYQAPVGHLFENEVVHRFHGRLKPGVSLPDPDPAEVMAVNWMRLDRIDAAIAARPDLYAPWFVIYMGAHGDTLREIAEA